MCDCSSRFLSITEVGKLFNPPISRISLWKWKKKGILRLNEIRIGSKVYYKKDEVIKEIERMKTK